MRNKIFSPSAALSILVLLSLLTVACSGADAPAPPAGPSDLELIEQRLTGAFDALAAGDIAGLMSAYSSDLTWDQGGYAEMEAFMTQANDAGFLEGFSYDTSALDLQIDGDTASATGISVEGAFGVLDLSFELEKRDGTWIVTKQSQQ